MLGNKTSVKEKVDRLTVAEKSESRRTVKRLKAGIMAGVMIASLVTVPTDMNKVHAANGTASELVSLAASQVGYHEKVSNASLDDFYANSGSNNYNKYARDVGVANGYAWCATFVWWLMRTAGVPDSSYPSRTTVTRDWFKQRGLYRARGTYTPKPGDYVIFGNVAHCGIVESVSGGNVTTIEGNSSNQVKRNTYAMSNSYILGYGIINYNGGASGGGTSTGTSQTDNPGSPYPIPTGNLRSGSRGENVKWVQKFADDVMGAGISVDGIYGNQTAYAVKVFQQNNGLTADGICGPLTTGKMLTVWRNKANEIQQAQHNPVGVLDLAESTKDGKLHVWGWMYDPDAVTKSNVVHVYVGGAAGTAGAECYAITANSSRKDVNDAYHVGEFHGFDAVIDTKKTGNQEVYVYGINEGAGTGNPEIGHKTVNLPASAHNPKFEIEEMYVTEKGKLRIKGWAYDPDDVTKSIDYHVYIGGDWTTSATSENTAYTANKSRKDIADKYGVGELHGIDIEVDTDREGSQPVYLYAINIGLGTNNPEMKKATLVFPEKWTVCDHKFTEYISNDDATCDEDGTKTAVCDKCHKAEDTVVDEGSATGNHTWNEGTIVKEATTKEQGVIVYRCMECDTVRYEIIPVIEDITAEATDNTDNNKEDDSAVKTEELIPEKPVTEGSVTEEPVTEESTAEEFITEESDVEEKVIVKAEEESEDNVTEPEISVDENDVDVSQKLNIEAETDAQEDMPVETSDINSGSQTVTISESELSTLNNMVWEDDEDDINVNSPIYKTVKNIKKRTLKISICSVRGVDGYEYTVAKVNDSTLKKLKKQIRRSGNAKIKFKGANTYSSKSTMVKLSGLKKNKKYAVVVRAYKVIDGKKYYSDYSSVKCIKIKK